MLWARAGQYCNFSARYNYHIEKYRDITIYRGFYKTCRLTVLLGCFELLLMWFCKYQTFVFNSVAITISSGLKRVSRHSKTAIIPKAIILFH